MKIFIHLVAAATVTLTMAMECDEGWFAYKESCYKMQDTKSNYYAAKRACYDEGSQLFYPDSAMELRDVLKQRVPKDQEVWINVSKEKLQPDYEKLEWKFNGMGDVVNGLVDHYSMYLLTTFPAFINPSMTRSYLYYYQYDNEFKYMCEKNSTCPSTSYQYGTNVKGYFC